LVDLTPYKEAIDAARNKQPVICADPKAAAMDVIAAEGGQLKGALVVGKMERIKGERCKTEKDFWYSYHEIDDTQQDGAVIGILNYGYWKDGTSSTWSSRSEHKMNFDERKKFHEKQEIMRAQREAEEQQRQADAAKKAFQIWSDAPQATDHPYLTKKGIAAAEGVKIADNGKLIVPVAVEGAIASLQFIDGDSNKRFLGGGKLKGGWFLIEGESDVIHIAEGYSTAYSVWAATGKTTYIAFNAGNLYEVASYVKSTHDQSRIIIAGDDDTGNETNVGRAKAEQAADGLGMEAVFPIGFNDFNDMHAEVGIEAVQKILSPARMDAYEPKAKEQSADVVRPTGVLGQIYDYYNVTSGNDQKGFAVQSAMACCSLILGRGFKTNFENYTSLYFLNVGETATGKEHAKRVFEKVMQSVGLGNLLAGDGYTSSGAVMSTLLDKPRHGVCTDELGRYLEAAMSKNGGNNNQREANTALMECFGRRDGIVRPRNYSSMTLKKKDADEIRNRLVHNPAITWLGMTTPSTFFNAIDINSVTDGFINRFIISISDAEPDIRRHKEPVEVPDTIINWVKAIMARNDTHHIASEAAQEVVVPLSEAANEAQIQFQIELLGTRKALKKYGMDGLVGRINEQAMCLSLIHTLSEDPNARSVSEASMNWAIDYMRECLNKTTERLKFSISHSEHEADKKQILSHLRSQGEDGMLWSAMLKTPPYSKHKSKDLKEILASLREAELAVDEAHQNPKGGRPTVKWIALK